MYYTAPCLAFLPFDFQIQYSSFNLRVLYTSSFPSSFSLTSSSSSNVFRSLLSLRRPCSCFRHLTSSMHRPYPPTPFISVSASNSLNIRKQNLIHPLNHPSHCAIPSSRQQLRFCFANRSLSITTHCTLHMCHFAHCRLSCISTPVFCSPRYAPVSSLSFFAISARSFAKTSPSVILDCAGYENRRNGLSEEVICQPTVDNQQSIQPQPSQFVTRCQATGNVPHIDKLPCTIRTYIHPPWRLNIPQWTMF